MLETLTLTKEKIINSQFDKIFNFVDEYRVVLSPYKSDIELSNEERRIAENASKKIKAEATLLFDLHYASLNSKLAKKNSYGRCLDIENLHYYFPGNDERVTKLSIRESLNRFEKDLLETSKFLCRPNG